MKQQQEEKYTCIHKNGFSGEESSSCFSFAPVSNKDSRQKEGPRTQMTPKQSVSWNNGYTASNCKEKKNNARSDIQRSMLGLRKGMQAKNGNGQGLMTKKWRVKQDYSRRWSSGEHFDNTISSTADDPSAVTAPDNRANPFSTHQSMTSDLLGAAAFF